MVTVGFAIWAAPVRKAWAEQLQASLDRDVPIVYDPVPVPSRNPQQRWDVCKLVLEQAAAQGCDYVSWIQDDAVVCADYCASVEAALAGAGNEILMSPYTGTGRPDQGAARRALRRAQIDDDVWMPLRSLYWGVAVAFPTHHVEYVLDAGSHAKFRHSPSDYRVGVVLREHAGPGPGLQTWYTHPSLVEHRDENSLVGHDKPGQRRRAHNFIGADVSGLSIDWTKHPRRSTLPTGGLQPLTDLARVTKRVPVPTR